MKWIRYHMTRILWRMNPRRGEICGDLACVCPRCAQPDCDCAAKVLAEDVES